MASKKTVRRRVRTPKLPRRVEWMTPMHIGSLPQHVQHAVFVEKEGTFSDVDNYPAACAFIPRVGRWTLDLTALRCAKCIAVLKKAGIEVKEEA